ncbi:hypothetical protein BSKO_06378 [Bryopsis sp. KO-2023]|nr:hypothetical protein BSKO_06378 [Bryopsis sp. KO-2023]
MARKKIREFDAKRLIKAFCKKLAGLDLSLNVVQVRNDTDFAALVEENPWLKSTKLVVKPDMLFGQRGKHNLVGLDLTIAEAEQFIRQRMNVSITVNECKGPVNTFVIEPFIPHDAEFYMSITSGRLSSEIRFSEAGGVEIEENWDSVKSVVIDTGIDVNASTLAPLLTTLPLEMKSKMEAFMEAIFEVYEELDFTFLEMNPFVIVDGQPLPLDMRAELDDTAYFRNSRKWGDLEFPAPFGRSMTSAESFIHNLDENTGASLKLSILNPKGRIWTMVAGGGASVIYADTIGDLGFAGELGNYAEYSGGANTKETYLYAKTLLDCATANPDGRGRALLVGGGIANFTDVAATFTGIIQAFRERVEDIKACKMKVFVRRGGPNYKAGLEAMRNIGYELGIPISVNGPDASMTGICREALDYVTSVA